MAAENLEAAAQKLGYELKVETHGSIGVEGKFSQADIDAADAVVIAADTVVAKDRFVGKRLVATGVDEAISHPEALLGRALEATALTSAEARRDTAESATPVGSRTEGTADSGLRSFGQTLYKSLMNGVSHMIPFVVTGGLLIAVALSIGGTPTPEGIAIPEGSFWFTINQLGALAFSLMVPILSGYIAVGIADRPGLAPGLITGLIATTGSLYGSDAGAGFIGGIITGILSGYIALAIKKIPVGKYVAPIWPIIVIPILTTLIVGLAFIYIIGHPVAAAFEAMTDYLAGMQGSLRAHTRRCHRRDDCLRHGRAFQQNRLPLRRRPHRGWQRGTDGHGGNGDCRATASRWHRHLGSPQLVQQGRARFRYRRPLHGHVRYHRRRDSARCRSSAAGHSS